MYKLNYLKKINPVYYNEVIKLNKEKASEAKNIAKEQALRIKNEFKRTQKETKNIEKNNRKINARKIIFDRMRRIGEMLMKESPEGFTAGNMTRKYIEVYGPINVWNGEINSSEYDTDAGVRSLLYEMSPSSAQHWFKYGIGRRSNEVAPWTFVNKSLAIVNNKYEWKTTTKGTGRANRKEKGLWIYVPLLIRELWSIEKYGPLPTEEMLVNAKLGRKIGIRGSHINVSVENLSSE
jgi:hypothetical protein